MRKTSILVVGSDARIGSYLYNNLASNEFIVFGTSRQIKSVHSPSIYKFTLSDNLYSFSEEKFDFAIICAGITDINYCEKNPDIAKEINVDSTIRLINHLKKSGTRVLFLSSNAVFDGSLQYVDYLHQTCPTTVYGITKVKVENYLLNRIGKDSILRLTKVIEPKAGFISKWETLFSNNSAIPIYTNHYLSPIFLIEVLDAVLRILRSDNSGIYQLGGVTEISYLEFAKFHFQNRPSALKLLLPELDTSVNKKFNSLLTFLPSSNVWG